MTIQHKFEEFHKDNPNVFRLFRRYSRMAKDAGSTQYSAKAIFERVRWHVNIATRSKDAFKLNNNYTSRYARMLADTDSSFTDFFVNRKLRS